MRSRLVLLCTVSTLAGLSIVPDTGAGQSRPCAPIADRPDVALTSLLTLADFQKVTGRTDIVRVVGHLTNGMYCDIYFAPKRDTMRVMLLLDTFVGQVQPIRWETRKQGAAATDKVVTGVGDEAFFANGAHLYFRKGRLTVALRLGSDQTTHKPFLTEAQVIALAKLVAQRL